MPVLPPISVTQSTAPAANAGAATNTTAWADALANTQTPPPEHAAATAAQAPAVTKHAAGQIAHGQAQPATEPPVAAQTKMAKATKPQSVYIPPAPSRTEKRDTHQASPVVAQAAYTPPLAKTAGETEQKTTAATADAKTNASATIANQNALGGDIASAEAGPTATPAKPTAKAETMLTPAVSSTNTQPSLPAVTTNDVHAPSTTTQSPMKADKTKALQPSSSQPATASTAQAVSFRATQVTENAPAPTKETEKSATQNMTALGNFALGSTQSVVATATSSPTASLSAVALTPSTAPAALAATVVALHQSGQAGTVLRLDPPGLGHLSVQVRLGAQGQVNVLFVPSTADAAQAIQASLPNLGAAMAQSGLMLGQAQVGGQSLQQGGQGGQSGYSPPRQNSQANFTAEPQATPNGLSAYA